MNPPPSFPPPPPPYPYAKVKSARLTNILPSARLTHSNDLMRKFVGLENRAARGGGDIPCAMARRERRVLLGVPVGRVKS